MSRMNDVVRDMLSLGAISVGELSEGRIQILDLVVRLACERARQAELMAREPTPSLRTDETRATDSAGVMVSAE